MQAPQGNSADDLELALSYDSTAAEYDRVATPNIFTPPAEDLVAMMELPAGGLVLDVGGGSGAVSVPAAKALGPAGLVVTLDPSVEMLRMARRKGLLWTVAGAAPRLPFVTGRFDVIAMVEVDELGALWDTVDKIQALSAVMKTTTNVVVQR